jgi:membrane protein implicated in regulation of membrane protease activity
MGAVQNCVHRFLNGVHWLLLIAIIAAAVSHWLLGFPSMQAAKILYRAFAVVCILGLKNALSNLDQS